MQFQEFLDQVLPDKKDQDDLQEVCGKEGKVIIFCGAHRVGKSALKNIIEKCVPNFKNTIITTNDQLGMQGYVFRFNSSRTIYFDSGDIQSIIKNDQQSVINFINGESK